MDFLEKILSQGLVQRLGWTLLHFVWQAGMAALLLAILLKLLRKSSANLRYIVACLALVIVVLLPAITMNLIPVTVSYSATEFEPEPAAITSTPVTIEQLSNIEAPVIETQHPVENVTVSPRIPFRQRIAESLEPFLPYVVSGWLVGVFGLSVWRLGGWTQLQRLRRRMVKPVDEPLRSKLKELAGILGVHRVVQLMESALVQTPTVVGWLKPVILLPASALTGFSADQLEAILAHELAHIKRYDYLVNMLQTVVEILGFYHPAVWWVSKRIRVERENCCDDIAVRVSGDSIGYAKTLASFEEIQAGQPELAVAAGGGSLFERICRLVGKDSAARNRPNWVPAIITMILLVGIVVPAALALSNKLKNKTEPSAVDLVRAVRESENWIHRVDSFYLRMESHWTKTPRGQDKINNEYKERFSGIALDPNRFPDLKPTRYDIEEFAQDRKRILYMTKDPDYWTQKKIWDGQKYMVHEKYFSSPQEHYVLDNALKDHFQMWLETYTSWLRSQPHSYWWNKKDTSKAMKSFGLAENFELKGETDYKGIGCYILEYDWDKSREFKSYRVNRWYVGTKDHLLYGNMRLQHNKPEVEHFTMDYRQVAPGCWFPMNQGYKLYDSDKSGEAYLAITRQFKILDIRINQPLADKLFQMELTPGVKVVDYRNGEPKTYTYVKPIPSLKGAALADLSQVGIKVPLDTFKDKAILVCFWDMQQRPSRRMVRELGKRAQELKGKGVAVVCIQASKVDKNALDEWVKKYNVPFPVGMVEGDEEKVRFSWGVKSLPWLILTDKDRVVRSEGFAIEELDEKLKTKKGGPNTEGVEKSDARIGTLEVVVHSVTTGKSLKGARVSFTNNKTGESFTIVTDEKGVGRINVVAGDYAMTNVSKEGYRSHKRDVQMEGKAGKVERIDIELGDAPRVTGYVRDKNGKSVGGASVIMVPYGPREMVTGPDGKFEFIWDPRGIHLFLVARVEEKNLAGSVEFHNSYGGAVYKEGETIQITIDESLTLVGQVAEVTGEGIGGAEVAAEIFTGMWPAHAVESTTDSQGNYELKAIPPGHEYWVHVNREGYGPRRIKVEGERVSETVGKVQAVVLEKANLSVSGVVVDSNGILVGGAEVKCWGEGQPKRQTKTNVNGGFTVEKICQGKLRIQADKGRLSGVIDAEGGKEDVRIILSRAPVFVSTYNGREEKAPPSLLGKGLPELDGIDIDFTADGSKNKKVLVCFWDMQQRPSRRMVRELGKRAQELKGKGVAVVCIQASKVDKNALDEWVKNNNISFLVGMVQGNANKTRFNWGVRSLPWLILTNKEQIVRAEGFNINELDGKIKALREK